MQDFEIIVFEGAYPSSVAMSRDILDAATQVATTMGIPKPTWGLYSLAGGCLHLRDGISVQTRRLPPRRRGARSICVIPGLGADPRALLERMQAPDGMAIARRLAAHVACGGQVAASCSAVFVLHAAGLLEGRRATTTWWLAPTLARIAPACTVDADRMVCVDGPIVTAGAAFAHADLMLHLLRERCGPGLSETVARLLLLEHRHLQASFVVPEILAGNHALVASLTARIEQALPNVPTILQLAHELCVSERTLARHVRRATGKSTRWLIQNVKLRRARALLENSRMTIDRIAVAVGYQDATALRRLLRKVGGTSPTALRTAASVGR
ncbi:MAG: helix-turn-helix domain-containing protein [Proteobacteria bacterium]|nr:helix-turn-helix domain-containing protein [Pseudomonadota bacterium]